MRKYHNWTQSPLPVCRGHSGFFRQLQLQYWRHHCSTWPNGLGLYLVSCSSGKQNSRTSLVGIVLIFSDLSAGMLSSRTVPRRGRRSEVLTISLYMKWSEVLVRLGPISLFSSPVAGTRSLLMVTATGPRFSSIPNQFWWSENNQSALLSALYYLPHLCHRRSFWSKLIPDQVSQWGEARCGSCKDRCQTSSVLTSAPVMRTRELVWTIQ